MKTLKKDKQTYIASLIQPIKTSQLLDQIKQQMELAIQEIFYHPIMYSELIKTDLSLSEKKTILRKYFKQRDINIVIQKYLEMLLQINNFEIIDDQDKPTFLSLLNEEIQTIHIIAVTVPTYVSDYVVGWIHTQLKEMIGYPFVLDVNVDPSQIGGIRIKADEFSYEETVNAKLTQLKSLVYDRVHTITTKLMLNDKTEHPMEYHTQLKPAANG